MSNQFFWDNDATLVSAWTPDDFTGNIELWLDFDDATTYTLNGSDEFTAITDKSPNAFSATIGNTPLLSDGTLNGKDGCYFNGSNEYLQFGVASDWTFLNYSESTIFLVANIWSDGTPAASSQTLLATYSTAGVGPRIWLLMYKTNTYFRPIISNSSFDAVVDHSINSTVQTNDPTLYEFDFDPGDGTAANRYDLYVDGVDQSASNTASNTASNSAPNDELNIGQRGNGTSRAQMIIYELLIIDGSITTGERTSFETYLNDKWGL